MANTVLKVLRTSTAGRQPNTTNIANLQYIDAGEFALNMADKILYTSNGSDLISVGANQVNQNITGNLTLATTSGIYANGSYGSAGQVLTTNATSVYWSSSLTVRSTAGSGGATNVVVGSVTGINFDDSTGIHITDQGSGNVFVSLGSGYKYIAVSGQTTITAVGEDTLNIANGQGIVLTTSNTVPKTLTIAINSAAQFTWTNTQTFSNDITFNSNVYHGTIGAANGIIVTNNQIIIGNNSVNSSINSTAFTGTSNNASYVGLVTAANVVSNTQLTSNLVNYQTTTGLSAVVATLAANNASYLGTIAAANYVQNTDSRTLSGNLNFTGANNTFGTMYTVGEVPGAVTNSVSANTTAILIGNSSIFVTVNSSIFSGTSLTANNASYLGGTVASGYQTTAGLSANVATLAANNASYLGTIAAANYVQNTDSRILSGNLNFTGANTYFSGKATHNANLVLNPGISVIDSTGSQGTSGQILSSNGSGNVYWASAGQASVNQAAQYTWTNTQTFSNTITFNSSILANTINAASHTVGTSFIANTTGTYHSGTMNAASHTVGALFTANSTLVNAAAINITGQVNAATLYATTSANVGTLVQANTTAYLVGSNTTVNTVITATSITQSNTTAVPLVANVTGIYHTGIINAASVSTTNATFQGINLTSNTSTTFSTYSTYFSTISVRADWPGTSLSSAGNGYTVEFFVKFASLGTTQTRFSDNGIAGLGFYANTSAINISDQGYSDVSQSGLNLQNSVWYHIAYIGRNNNTYIAVNGTVYNLSSAGGHFNGGTWGGWGNLEGPATFSNFRVVTGSAVYSLSGFAVPSAPLTAISGTYVLTLQDSTFIDNSGSSRSVTTTGSPTLAADTISISLASASTVGTLNNGNLTIPVITPTFIYANSATGTAGQVLTSNSAGGLYWSTPAAATNVAAQYAWTNTQTFSNTITFSNNILIGANVSLNTSSIAVGNSTVNTFSNSSFHVVANSTGTANLTAVNLTIGSGIVNTSGFAAGANVYGNTSALFVGNSTVNTFVNSSIIQVSNSTVIANLYPNGLITGNTVANTTVLQANTVVARGSANIDVQLNIGANVIANTSALSVANSTVNAVHSLQSLIIQANSTVNGTISSTQTYIANSTGNSIIVPTSITVQNSTVNAVHSLQSLIIQANTTVNSSHTATLLQVSNSTSTANLTASDLKIGAATVVNSSVVNASSITVGTNFIANTTQLTITVPFSANGGVGTAGQVLTSNGSIGSPYWVTAASGGSVNTANQYVFSNTITFSANQTLFTSSNASPNAIAGAIVSNGGIAANGNIYTAGRIGFANSAGANQAYTYYNTTTSSLDTVFG